MIAFHISLFRLYELIIKGCKFSLFILAALALYREYYVSGAFYSALELIKFSASYDLFNETGNVRGGNFYILLLYADVLFSLLFQ